MGSDATVWPSSRISSTVPWFDLLLLEPYLIWHRVSPAPLNMGHSWFVVHLVSGAGEWLMVPCSAAIAAWIASTMNSSAASPASITVQ
jgi:hypothetical protein